LDLWNTLLFPNPEFSEKRNWLIQQTVNSIFRVHAGFYEVHQYLSEISSMSDKLAKTGCQLKSQHMYVLLLDKFEINIQSIGLSKWDETIHILQHNVDELFIKYPPKFPEYDQISKIIKNVLDSNQVNFINVISNTGWIRGNVIELMLIAHYPEFHLTERYSLPADPKDIDQNEEAIEIKVNVPKNTSRMMFTFSDNEDCTKPHPYAFENSILYKEKNDLQWHHIGDDKYSDGTQAIPLGYTFHNTSQKITAGKIVEQICRGKGIIK
jgi:hypothetical protein